MSVEPIPSSERSPTPAAGTRRRTTSGRAAVGPDYRSVRGLDGWPGPVDPGSRGGILAVCRVAGRLAGLGTPGPVDIGRYLRALCAELDGDHGEPWTGPSIVCAAGPALLPAATTLLVGIVVEQLVSNALTRGFPPCRRHRRIAVDCIRQDERCVVTVADNGVALGSAPRHRETGMLFVRLLALQLDGTLSVASAARGTTWALTFAAAEPAPAAPATGSRADPDA